MINLSHSYFNELPSVFYEEIKPSGASKAEFVCFNEELAESLKNVETNNAYS